MRSTLPAFLTLSLCSRSSQLITPAVIIFESFLLQDSSQPGTFCWLYIKGRIFPWIGVELLCSCLQTPSCVSINSKLVQVLFWALLGSWRKTSLWSEKLLSVLFKGSVATVSTIPALVTATVCGVCVWSCPICIETRQSTLAWTLAWAGQGTSYRWMRLFVEGHGAGMWRRLWKASFDRHEHRLWIKSHVTTWLTSLSRVASSV